LPEVPVNEKLYAMVVTQAKAKYRIYPSPGASHWVHRRYLELGGKYIDSEEIAERKRIIKAWQERKAKLRGHNDEDKKDSK
jgi:hypothetical protein